MTDQPDEKPEEFSRFEKLLRAIVRVPKREVVTAIESKRATKPKPTGAKDR